jgi:signal transduction histidine kinase/DNA-binding response OmpR family regulator
VPALSIVPDSSKRSRAPAWLSLRSRGGLALLFGLVVALAIAFLSYRSWSQSARTAVQADVTRRTRTGINALILAATNAETGQRGFLLTGEDRYLAPYLQARNDIPRILAALKTTTLVRLDQGQRIEKLGPLIDAKMAELAQTIQLRRTKSFDAAVAVVLTDHGRVLMVQIRAICAEIMLVTNGRLAEYSEKTQSTVDQGLLISTLGSAALFMLLLVAHFAIQKETAGRLALIDELQRSERRLESVAEQAESANRAKSIFLSTMSHEIRTPLNAILGYAQLMARDPAIGSDAKTNLKIIGRSGEHLLSLLNDVLDMSKIEAGRTELKPVTFNLYAMLKDLSGMFRLRAEAKGLHFEMIVDGISVPYVRADEGKIRQSIINLLVNAIKFTKRGQVKLHVTVEERSHGQHWLSAQVADTGAGIAADEHHQLFEPFRQAKRGLNVQGGTGLGLAISRQFARLMGGDITVLSQPGQGSIFRFEVPIESGDSGVSIRRSEPRDVIAIRAGSNVPKVLVVDDQFENRDWLIKLLISVGFSARGAENGELAIRSWEDWNPDLILMDVHMPVMDGLEATRKIKEHPRGRETLIVVLTASALDEDRQTATESRADDFLSKPLRDDDLLEKVGKLLDVTYEYRDTDQLESQSIDEAPALTAQTLSRLPSDMLRKLRDATVSGNKKLLNELILSVLRVEDHGCARSLQQLADKYEYDTLTRLLEDACRL